jgi:hypothetical protein
MLDLTSSTSGRIATIDLWNDANRFLWTHEFASPIVAMFELNDGIAPEVLVFYGKNMIESLKTNRYLLIGMSFLLHSNQWWAPFRRFTSASVKYSVKGSVTWASMKWVNEQSLWKYSLIKAMINPNPNSRPMIVALIKQPLFWDSNKSLQFLQHVSDRIEKEPTDSPI